MTSQAMIPIRDQIPSRKLPRCHPGHHRPERSRVPLPDEHGREIRAVHLHVRPGACALLRSGDCGPISPSESSIGPAVLHVPSRGVLPPPREHVVSLHLRRQRGGPHGLDPVSAVLPPVRLGFGVCASLVQLGIDGCRRSAPAAPSRESWGLSHPLPKARIITADPHLLHPYFIEIPALVFLGIWFLFQFFYASLPGPRAEAASPGGPHRGLCVREIVVKLFSRLPRAHRRGS